MTRDAEAALTILFARLVQQRAAPIGAGAVRAMERAIVRRRFAGDRAAYLAEVRRAGASPAVALGGIADELRRETLLVKLAARTPSATEVAEFAQTYAGVQLRDIPGAGEVDGVEPTTPLGLLPDELARPVIVRALRHVDRAARYSAWAERSQERALKEIRCTRDRLPTVGSTPLTSWMPFLAPVLAGAG